MILARSDVEERRERGVSNKDLLINSHNIMHLGWFINHSNHSNHSNAGEIT